MGIVFNFLRIPSYRCLDTSNFFLFSDILMLLLWSEILVLRACVETIYTLFYITFYYVDYVFLSCGPNIYYEFFFRVFEGIGFSFYNYITYSTSSILASGNSFYCVSMNVVEGVFLKRLRLSGF